MKKLIIIVLAFIAVAVFTFSYSNRYTREAMLGNSEMTLTPLESCTCLGSLATMASDPLQYSCTGIEICRDTENEVIMLK